MCLRKTEICTTCNKPLTGRIDKIFCTIKCKNIHHKIAKIQSSKIQKIGNKRIIRNYIILEGIFGKDTKSIKVHQDKLFSFGFDFNSFLRKMFYKKKVFFEILEYRIRYLKNGLIEIHRKTINTNYFEIFMRRWLVEFKIEVKEKIVKMTSNKKYFERLSFFRLKDLTAIPLKTKDFKT